MASCAVDVEEALIWLPAFVHGETGGDAGSCGLPCLGFVGGCMLMGWKASGAWRKLSRGACSGGDIMRLLIAKGFLDCIAAGTDGLD